MPIADSVTLSVDTTNDNTPVNEVISLFDGTTGRKEFHFPGHSFTSRETVVFTRSLPKQSGNFAGTRKTTFKLTDDEIVDGVDPLTDVKAPGILEINCSLPVGISSAVAKKMRQRAIAILDNDVLMQSFQERCEV